MSTTLIIGEKDKKKVLIFKKSQLQCVPTKKREIKIFERFLSKKNRQIEGEVWIARLQNFTNFSTFFKFEQFFDKFVKLKLECKQTFTIFSSY